MTSLVVRDHPLLFFAHDTSATLWAGEHTVDGLVELHHADLPEPAARRQQGRFVQQVGEVRAGESGCALGQRLEVDAVGQRLALRVDLQDAPYGR